MYLAMEDQRKMQKMYFALFRSYLPSADKKSGYLSGVIERLYLGDYTTNPFAILASNHYIAFVWKIHSKYFAKIYATIDNSSKNS